MIQHKLYGAFVRCNWKGLYGWGVGWLSFEQKKKWHDFWTGKQPKLCHYDVMDPGLNSASALSICSHSYENWTSSIYLHPQGFHTWITGNSRNEVESAVYSLQRLCEEAAKAADGEVDEFYALYPEDHMSVAEF